MFGYDRCDEAFHAWSTPQSSPESEIPAGTGYFESWAPDSRRPAGPESGDYAAPLGAGPGGYTPPVSWTETNWPKTPHVFERPPAALPIDTIDSIPSYEDTLRSQQLIDAILTERNADHAHEMHASPPMPIDAITGMPSTMDQGHTQDVNSDFMSNSPLAADSFDSARSVLSAGLEGRLDNEIPPTDPLMMLASQGFVGLGP